MTRASILGMAVTTLSCSVVLADPVWTETFDTGVGRLDQVRGNGADKFVWNSVSHQIDGEFVRYSSADRRFAVLDQPLTNDDVFGFSAVVTPTAISPESNTSAKIGFWDSRESPMESWLGVKLRETTGAKSKLAYLVIDGSEPGQPVLEPGSTYFEFDFGQTYFLDFLMNGEGLITLDVFNGSSPSGDPVHTMAATLPRDFYFDALGMGNPTGGSTTFWMSVDDVSFVVPEPTTALLVATAGVFALRRHRRG